MGYNQKDVEIAKLKAELEQAQAEWRAECIDKAKILAELDAARKIAALALAEGKK